MTIERDKTRRELQDIFALIDHAKTLKTRKDGVILKEEIIPVELKNGKIISKDEIIREKGNFYDSKNLKPVFRKEGKDFETNSSIMIDGASVVLIMNEEKAIELGY